MFAANSHGLLLCLNLLIPVSILIFATGFFPYKPFLPGLAEYEALEYGAPPKAPFDRLIFMVVDALRSDFVYAHGSGFEFTHELIRNGAALPFTANARSPTITMPRIKAITTGSIPSFVDVILNFDEADKTSNLAAQDTWLAQMKKKDSRNLVMYGDDTWLKLFPGMFGRADGTSSFFVSDFTEVDNNVTRHITGELARDDWNTMVLHYLGLDHIGHKTGPRSSNMWPKQREMDLVIKEIFEAMKTSDALSTTLLVVCGDHGMNDAGNHGGSSPGETSSALVFVSPLLRQLGSGLSAPATASRDFQYYSTVEQSDLAPTLAALLGFPVPRNNLGALITDFLCVWSPSDQAQLLIRNARQILDVVTTVFPAQEFDVDAESGSCDGSGKEPSGKETLACSWKSIIRRAGALDDVDEGWFSSMSTWLAEAQDLMSSMASNYDVSRLVSGLALASSIVAATLVVAPYVRSDSLPGLAVIIVSQGASMFSSSFVEEEHHFWYWTTSAWAAYLGTKRFRNSRPTANPWPAPVFLVLALLTTRIFRGWNQTGQKFAGELDIVKTYVVPRPAFLWAQVGVTYAWVASRMYRCWLPTGIPSLVLVLTTTLVAMIFKLAFTREDAPELIPTALQGLSQIVLSVSLLHQARLFFFALLILASQAVYVTAFIRTRRSQPPLQSHWMLLYAYSLLAITQSRLTNIPLLLLMHIQFVCLQHGASSVADITTSCILLQHMSFFAFGGSNSIASVDLSNAYNGIGGFNVVAVGVLTFLGNWTGPIHWTFATSILLLQHHRQGGVDSVWTRHLGLLTLSAACQVVAVMTACTVMRTHLFIWTVFSPKYLYCMAWNIGQHLIVNVGLGGLLHRLGM